MLFLRATVFTLFISLIVCFSNIPGAITLNDSFFYTLRSPTSGNDERVASSVSQVLKSFAMQRATGGVRGGNGSYTAEFHEMLKKSGSFVILWLESLTSEFEKYPAINTTTATTYFKYDLPVYGQRERSMCDYYIESFFFFFFTCILSRTLWITFVNILKINNSY